MHCGWVKGFKTLSLCQTVTPICKTELEVKTFHGEQRHKGLDIVLEVSGSKLILLNES